MRGPGRRRPVASGGWSVVGCQSGRARVAGARGKRVRDGNNPETPGPAPSIRQNISDDEGGSTSAGLREGIQSPVIIWS
jgi:hypothetical protein